MTVFLLMNLTGTFNGQFQFARQGVYHRYPDPVQTARHFITVVVELTAGVQDGQNHLGSRYAFFRVNVGWNAATVIGHRYRFIFMNSD